MPAINIGGEQQAGRTTRMLEEALDVCMAAEGDTTIVVVACHLRSAQRLCSQAEDMLERGGGKPGRGRGSELLVSTGPCRLLFTTPNDRGFDLQGRATSSEFWDHFAVERVHEERLRLKDQVASLAWEVKSLNASLSGAQAEAVTLKLETDDLKTDLDSRKAAE